MSMNLTTAKEVNSLKEIRECAGISQQALADEIGVRQPTIHKIENQSDFHLSSLHRYIEGLGGSLELQVNLPGVGQFLFSPNRAPEKSDIPIDYAAVCTFVASVGKARTSLIQREFGIGYNDAKQFIEQMERDGIVGPADKLGVRAVLKEAD